MTNRLKKADIDIYDERETTCCYSKSNKAWVSDPAGVPWEAYQNMSDIEVFGEKENPSHPVVFLTSNHLRVVGFSGNGDGSSRL
jgi:hypothetical protein